MLGLVSLPRRTESFPLLDRTRQYLIVIAILSRKVLYCKSLNVVVSIIWTGPPPQNMPRYHTSLSERRHILHVAYYESLLSSRTLLLQRSGYTVSSALGNKNAIALAATADPFDLAVIGFSAGHEVRAELLHWFKLHRPEVPVVVLQAHTSEKFPEADCVPLSESPETWLAAIAGCIGKI